MVAGEASAGERALIISVGGTPEAVARALAEHRPGAVCFFASQQTVGQIGLALEKAGQLCEGSWRPAAQHTVLTDDAQDLVGCYEKAVAGAAWLEGLGLSPHRVVVDYTGGTKAMTAALALATVGKGFAFSYVGGTQREKGGVGTVVSGSEVVRAVLDPWHLFAVEERRRLVLAFNGCQFEAAIQILQGLLGREGLDSPRRRWFEALQVVCEGYRAWDRFQYPEALDRLCRAQKLVATQADLVPAGPAAGLARAVASHATFLESLRAESDAFRRPSPAMLSDLLGNADRRAGEGKYDDAVARLYRATELVAQAAFLRPPLSCPTGAVPVDRLPATLREEYAARYGNRRGGALKLPLRAAFRVLREVGAAEGEAFFAREQEFEALLAARNASLLAHGFSPVLPETFERFRALVSQCFPAGEPPAFPRLAAA